MIWRGRCDQRVCEQRPPDAAAAGRLGDDQIREPGVRRDCPERIAPVQAADADHRPVQLGDHGPSLAGLQPTQVVVKGTSKQVVGQTAAEIRKVRPPEPYKGKGIRYQGEQVRRKVGKRA